MKGRLKNWSVQVQLSKRRQTLSAKFVYFLYFNNFLCLMSSGPRRLPKLTPLKAWNWNTRVEKKQQKNGRASVKPPPFYHEVLKMQNPDLQSELNVSPLYNLLYFPSLFIFLCSVIDGVIGFSEQIMDPPFPSVGPKRFLLALCGEGRARLNGKRGT